MPAESGVIPKGQSRRLCPRMCRLYSPRTACPESTDRVIVVLHTATMRAQIF